MIRQLQKQITEDLCAQQVITTLPDCIKQLLENSIDAEANRIHIKLQDYGKKNILIADNGIGIDDFSLIGQKGTTSKNKGLSSVKTLGFRGEALNSIARVSESIIIESKTENSKGSIFNLKTLTQQVDHKKLINKGTTIIITQLFKYLPVRRQQLLNKYKEYLKIVCQMIKQYAIIHPQITFIVINQRQGKEQILVQSQSHKSWYNRLVDIFGIKIGQKLAHIEGKYFQGYVLNKIESGSSRENSFLKKNIHFMYLNKRPIDKPQAIMSLLDSIYKKYNSTTKYMFFINLQLNEDDYDVNLNPNKRQIYIKKNIQKQILNQISKSIEANVIQDIPKMQNYQQRKSVSEKIKSKIKNNQMNQEVSSEKKVGYQKINFRDQLKLNITKKQQTDHQTNNKQCKIQPNNQSTSVIEALNKHMNAQKSKSKTKIKQFKPTYKIEEVSETQKQNNNKIQQHIQIVHLRLSNPLYQKQRQKNNNYEEENNMKPINGIQQKQQKEIREQHLFQHHQKQAEQIQIENRQIQNPQANKSLKKQQFQQFNVLGQFNLGFIVSQHNGSFYLIDQHAASEKDKFQTLMKQNVKFMHTNDEVEINAIVADAIQSNIANLKKDGFGFELFSRSKIKFSRYPIFLDKTFNKDYFFQLLENNVNLKQLEAARNIAATKACRSAIMIGDVLSQKQMNIIVEKLSELQSPWNCPHGRPTLIQLGSYNKAKQKIKYEREYSF